MNLLRNSRGWHGGRPSIIENRPKVPPTPHVALDNPFTAIPVRPEDVELRRDSRGLIHLRRRQTLSGLRRRMADWLHYDYYRRLELDEYGTLYYGLVDGAHNLCMIVDAFAAVPPPRPRQEIEQAVVLFTRKLMTMNMLALKIPAQHAAPLPL